MLKAGETNFKMRSQNLSGQLLFRKISQAW